MDQMLAVFPLPTVLFPGATLGLHILEERDRQMIGRCIKFKQPFGVVLTREGQSAGDSVEPHEIGTTATVVHALRLDDGRMYIAARGGTRFRIRRIAQREPHLIASIELLDEHVNFEERLQADQLCVLYDQYRSAIARATGVAQSLADLPRDPVAMSFELSAQLHVPYLSKQQLLEADLETRLEALTEALTDELRFLPPPSPSPIQPGNTWSLN